MNEEAVPILEPIVLSPPTVEKETVAKPTSTRGKTFRTMLLGWFLGNLILGAVISATVIVAIGSTGLVKVPLLTNSLFGQAEIAEPNEAALETANQKLDKIYTLSEDQSLPTLTIKEEELSALLASTFQEKGSTIANPNLKIENGAFVFTGTIKETGAPVKVEGEISTNGGVLHLGIEKTVFGKLSLPPQLMTSYINSILAQVGLSLDITQIPAQKILAQPGKIVLEDVKLAD